MKALHALSWKNDPYFAGAESNRAQAEWFAALWDRFDFPRGVHLRRIHYVLVSQEPPVALLGGGGYANTEACFNELIDASRAARHLGMVAPDAFEDHRNPRPLLFADPPLPEGYDGEPSWFLEDLLGWHLPRINTSVESSSLFLPDITVAGYSYCLQDQPYHLELWIEKSTMNDVLAPICEGLGVNLATGVGFQSISGVVQMLLRIARLPRGKPARVFTISDFDPAGQAMPVGIARLIEFYREKYAPGAGIKLTPVALTEDQVRAYRLPRTPIKEGDVRKGRFEERHGEGAVELDALEALRPGELGRVVQEAFSPYRDDDLEGALDDAREEAEQAARDAWDEAFGEDQEALREIEEEAREIADRYRQRLVDLDNELQAELAPLAGRLQEVRQAVQLAGDSLEVELPERPDPDPGGPDEDDWLLDSGRGYLDQMGHYKSFQKKEAPGDRAKLCSVCGGEFHSIRSDAQVCPDPDCQRKARAARKRRLRARAKEENGHA
jgi:hypothetical protein